MFSNVSSRAINTWPVWLIFMTFGVTPEAQRVERYSPNTPAKTLDLLVRESDVIVQGTIGGSQALASEGHVYTDYTVTVQRVLLQRVGAFSDRNPGTGSAMAFRQAGGTVAVDGETVTARVAGFPDEPFPRGVQVVLFLKYVPEFQRFFLASGPYAAFRIERGVIKPLKRNPHEKRHVEGEASNQFIADVERLIAASHVR